MRSQSSRAISMRRRTRPCCNWPVLPAQWRSSYDDSDQGPGPIRRTRDRLGAGEGDRPRSPAAPSGLARAVGGVPAGVPVPADRFCGPERGAAAGEELSRAVGAGRGRTGGAGDRPWRHGAVPGGAGSARLDRGAGVSQPAADGPGGDGDRRAQRQPAHRGQGAGVAGERAQRRPAAQG